MCWGGRTLLRGQCGSLLFAARLEASASRLEAINSRLEEVTWEQVVAMPGLLPGHGHASVAGFHTIPGKLGRARRSRLGRQGSLVFESARLRSCIYNPHTLYIYYIYICSIEVYARPP